jgi:hypothetical protein
MALSFAYLLTSALPGTQGVSWLAHLGGLVGGVLAGWLFREGGGEDRGEIGPGRGDGLSDTAILPGGGGRKQPTGGSLPGSPRSDLLKELDDLGL